MKKLNFLIIIIAISLLAPKNSQAAPNDLVVFRIPSPPLETDGVKDAEWDTVNSRTITLDKTSGEHGPATRDVTFYACHNLTYLWCAFEYPDATNVYWESCGLILDTDEDGVWGGSDYRDYVYVSHRSSGYVAYDEYNFGTGYSSDSSQDVTGSGSYSGGSYFMELAHDLNSGDSAGYDVNLEDGDVILYQLRLIDNNGTHSSIYFLSTAAELTISASFSEMTSDILPLLSVLLPTLITAVIIRKKNH